MSRKIDSKGDTINQNRRSRQAATNSADIDRNVNENLFSSALANARLLTETMAFFCDHDTGALKVRRATDSADLHLTWTWSIGSYRGSYVYVRVEHWRLLFGLELLQQKVLDVEEGQRKPTPDRMNGV